MPKWHERSRANFARTPRLTLGVLLSYANVTLAAAVLTVLQAARLGGKTHSVSFLMALTKLIGDVQHTRKLVCSRRSVKEAKRGRARGRASSRPHL